MAKPGLLGMLEAVDLRGHKSTKQSTKRAVTRALRVLRLGAVGVLPVAVLAGCSRFSPAPTADVRAVSASQQQVDADVRQQMEMIPPPSKTRYMAVRTLTSWENPYLTVQDNMLTLHVTLADANTSTLGQGGMFRPAGARRQDLTLRVGELPAALNAVPQNAWPYGRVVAVEEAHNVPAKARPEVRRNMETVMKLLGDLGVVVYEWSEAGAGLR